jgi:hypothetical protein
MNAKTKGTTKAKTKTGKASESAPKETSIPPAALALYDKLIATNPDIERKGAKLPYTSVNGNMFTFLSEAGLMGLRLPAEEREVFLKKYKTGLFEAHGAVMKEYVTVPETLLKNTKALSKYLEASYRYVKTLKPKAQKIKTAQNKS